jgi:two-component system OmpR family response regulator
VRVLLVEDSERLSRLVTELLTSAGHHVLAVATASAGLRALAEGSLDAAVIDIGLPDGSGLDICRRARAEGHDVPILLLTARNGVAARVEGLDAGADDYMGKPFAAAELVARLRALGRRRQKWTESLRAFGDLKIDRDRRAVERGGRRVPLTPRELDIVFLLAWRDGRVVTRDELLESVWGETSEGAAASLEVLITRIRRKLDTPESASSIRTVRNLGYAWELRRSKPA